MERDIRREQALNLMVGFMKDKLYEGQEVSNEDLMQTAAIYYDLVEAVVKALEQIEREAAAAATAASKAGKIDASNPTQVDLTGGPTAIDRQTGYRS